MHRLRVAFLLLCCFPAPGAGQVLTPADSARHLLNRLAFGPRPGEIDRVATAGVLRTADRWLESGTGSDPALASRERAFQPDRFTTRTLFEDQRKVREARRRARGDSLTAPGARTLRRVLAAYQQLTVVRAITAEDQVREVMVDFWTNHFNVFLNKGADRAMVPTYVEQVIRPHALGKFEDLLVATAKSPAMLFYLDNVRSVTPGLRPPPRFRNDSAAARRPTGINENYARELLELHTLGVDGGYTQLDVTEVARILTGWSMEPPDRGGGFVFRARVHDTGAKVVLGMRFPPGHGLDEGERLLRFLAHHPATLHHISRKLCARLVADDPPDGCVDAAVHAWEQSDGQILAVLRAIVHSPEFWSGRAVAAKIKSPLEFVASAARAVGADPDTTPALAAVVGRLGQPLFQHQAPDGYPEREEAWVNSGALLERMNLAVALAAGRIPGSRIDLDAVVQANRDPDALVEAVDQALFAGRLTARTRDAIRNELTGTWDPAAERALAVGLALGSPEFQRQ
jgi:uncharacterized protein (DUF1800 family)